MQILCNTCNNTEICNIYQNYKHFIVVSSCSKYNECNIHKKENQENILSNDSASIVPYRNKNIDLKMLYPQKKEKIKYFCDICGNEETSSEIKIICDECGKSLCTNCMIVDTMTDKHYCEQCYNI